MMFTQLSHFVVDCPNCSRPVEFPSHGISHELVCGHCRGEFIVYDNEDGKLTAAKLNRDGSLERSEPLLGRTNAPAYPDSSNCGFRPFCVQAVRDDETDSQDGLQVAPDAEESPDGQRQATALLVEFRDEVFIRVATDMAQAGMRVIRACSATEALQLDRTFKPSLVLVNVDQRDQSGWLLAAKLKFVDPSICVWIYQPQSSVLDVRMAEFLEVDELLDYRGDIFRLSDTVMRLLNDSREPVSAMKAIKTEELSVA